MDPKLLIFVLVLSSIIHFTVQKFFIYKKKFDDFNYRSSHNTLATRTGGIGIFLIVFLISFYYYLQGIEIFDYSLLIPLGIMFIVGVYDDFYSADFKLKFLLQIIVAKILIDQGFVITNYHGLFGFYEIPWILAQLSTVFVFLVIINSINFIDGIDGLAITEAIKTVLLIEFFSVSNTLLRPLGVLLVLSLLPLYYFNFKKKRKVFLGDGGSLLIGTILSIYIFYVLGDDYVIKTEYTINKVLFTISILAYPLIDLLRVFTIRIKNKKSPFEADKNHIHHKLLKKVSSHFIVICLILIVNLILIYLVV